MGVRFSNANTKVAKLAKVPALQPYLEGGRKIYNFDLLAGHSCPFAHECKSKVVNGKVKDGKHTKYRCFAASLEALYPTSYNLHKENFDTLRKLDRNRMLEELESAIPHNAGIVRVHSSGDFFNYDYFRAWMQVARNHPNILFYAYTKSLTYWSKYRPYIPKNFVLTASRGGLRDDLITKKGFREAIVIFHEDEAEKLGLEIDKDDSHAANSHGGSFTLLIHGVQPKKKR